jgi:hypothetical protein
MCHPYTFSDSLVNYQLEEYNLFVCTIWYTDTITTITSNYIKTELHLVQSFVFFCDKSGLLSALSTAEI